MTINLLTLFPSYFNSLLKESIIKRAIDSGIVKINVINIRDFATNKHHITDDRPFGGGAGMVMKVEPIYKALQDLSLSKGQDSSKIILTSAKGESFTQQTATDYSKLTTLTIICGHYEGVDERVAENLVDEEIRVGDFVLTGGEPAANVILDAVTRLIPGVLGNEESNKNESHSLPGHFAYPQYTRPEEFNNWTVPKVLLSGDHQQINTWREENSTK
ncbi:MAG: tRNA (guanosine(37)-N1)-methyltransferase TrmD [Candidatus Pacebacteria bacterium]|nr:tRNA (guanosine(37)-N1)-methyltransferase TrmD [Candidatus Paceibacterota bacterium]